MPDRLRVLFLSLPLVLAGSLFAHEVAYRAVGPGGGSSAPGHAYFGQVVLAVQVALVAALLVEVIAGVVTGQSGALAAWPFAFVAPVAFTVQEHLERALSGGEMWGTVAEPSFVVGLLLQLPFVLGAWLVARLLLRAVACVVTRRGHSPSLWSASIAVVPASGAAPIRRVRSLLASCAASRAPPSFAG